MAEPTMPLEPGAPVLDERPAEPELMPLFETRMLSGLRVWQIVGKHARTDFPQPVETAAGARWRRAEVLAWKAEHALD